MSVPFGERNDKGRDAEMVTGEAQGESSKQVSLKQRKMCGNADDTVLWSSIVALRLLKQNPTDGMA